MNLLIVDDQIHVLKGLEQAISWTELGFDQVFTALNAIEARQIITQTPIDVMLCDIEMPFESGLSLIRWLRKANYPIRCILLTAHPDFEYAKDAIQLDVTDYVVQPAPYSDIVRAVSKACDEIAAVNRQQELSRLGAEVHEKQELLASLALSALLQSGQKSPYQTILEFSKDELPSFDTVICLAAIRIMRWNCKDDWDNASLFYALSNIIHESFESYGQKAVFTELESREYVCMIWSPNSPMDGTLLTRQFEFIRNVFCHHFNCEISIYFDAAGSAEHAPKTLAQIRNMHRENLAHRSMVKEFRPQPPRTYEANIPVEKFKEFELLLAQGYPNATLDQAKTFLAELEQNGLLTQSLLRNFYQDFMQILYNAAKKTGVSPQKIFESPDAFELYKNATHSLEDMNAFLTYVCQQYTALENPANTGRMVEQVIEYIERNLEKDLRRDEIADYVHISPSYLSRIFRKEVGIPLKEYIIHQKMKMAQTMLRSTTLPISLIAVKVGYNNFSQFSQIYKGVIGNTPSVERKSAETETE